MPYLRPSGLTRKVVNPLVSRLRPRGVETLTVTGRRSGRPHSVPVLPVQIGSQRYLVAPYGESDWVQNLRATGEGTLRGHGAAQHFTAREVPEDRRSEVISAYRHVAGRTVERCFRSLPDPGAHPVFEIEPGPGTR